MFLYVLVSFSFIFFFLPFILAIILFRIQSFLQRSTSSRFAYAQEPVQLPDFVLVLVACVCGRKIHNKGTRTISITKVKQLPRSELFVSF